MVGTARKEQNKQEEIHFFNKASSTYREDEVANQRDCINLYKIAHLNVIRKAQVLEAGCGIGVFGRMIAKAGNTVVGIDISPKSIEIANSYGVNNYHAVVGDLEDQQCFENMAFDVICCLTVLHHFPTIDKVMDNLSTWLKVPGKMIILEPNGSNPIHKFKRLVGRFLRLITPKYFLDKHLSTSNETYHSLAAYLMELKDHNLNILEQGYYHTLGKPKTLIGYANYYLYICAYHLLPQALGSSSMFVVAEKRT